MPSSVRFYLVDMPLTKWVSNSKLVTSRFNDRVDIVKEDEATRVLGLHWYNNSYTFSFHGIELSSQVELELTKQSVLSFIAKVFDSLGLIIPFVMYGKVLFQDIWRLDLLWDDLLSLEQQIKFQK